MLRKEVNDLLTQTDKGTPHGRTFPAVLDAGYSGIGTSRKTIVHQCEWNSLAKR